MPFKICNQPFAIAKGVDDGDRLCQTRAEVVGTFGRVSRLQRDIIRVIPEGWARQHGVAGLPGGLMYLVVQHVESTGVQNGRAKRSIDRGN